MHRLVQKQNERTQSSFLDPILMFWIILVSFITVPKTMSGCIYCTDSGQKLNDAPTRPETKRMQPVHFFGPNSDVWVHLGQFRNCVENRAGVAFNAPSRAEKKRCTDSGQKQNKSTQSTFLDPILMFWFILLSFITVPKTMSRCI